MIEINTPERVSYPYVYSFSDNETYKVLDASQMLGVHPSIVRCAVELNNHCSDSHIKPASLRIKDFPLIVQQFASYYRAFALAYDRNITQQVYSIVRDPENVWYIDAPGHTCSIAEATISVASESNFISRTIESVYNRRPLCGSLDDTLLKLLVVQIHEQVEHSQQVIPALIHLNTEYTKEIFSALRG